VSAIRLSAAKERIEYADEYGDEAALAHFSIKSATLSRYRRVVAEVDVGINDMEYRALFDKLAPTRWTDHPRIYGDCLILNDIHLPFVDKELLHRALRVAKLLDIKQVAILGDLIDFESVSKFDFGSDQYELMDELYVARDFLGAMEKQFDRIVFIRGNHDERVIKFLKRIKKLFIKETTDNEYAAYHAIIGVNVSQTPWHQYKTFFESDKVEVSNYAKCEFEDKYLGVHPSNYSRNPPTVEKQLAHKYHRHIIGTHGHLTALGFDSSGDYIVAQFGGILDKELVFYKNMRETTHPDWVPAFGWIYNKKLGYYIEHQDLLSIFDYMKIGKGE